MAVQLGSESACLEERSGVVEGRVAEVEGSAAEVLVGPFAASVDPPLVRDRSNRTQFGLTLTRAVLARRVLVDPAADSARFGRSRRRRDTRACAVPIK